MRKRGNVFIVCGILFMIISIAMMFYNNYENKNAQVKSKKIYNIIEENTKLKKFDVKNYETEVININGYEYIGTIKIPSLSLELPIMNDWNYNKMKISPCKYYGSIYTNDLVICAHAYKSLFGTIKELNIKDIVIITDINNNSYYYEVKTKEILSPNDVKSMIESEFDLTLYTCTIDNLNRLTIRLNRVY